MRFRLIAAFSATLVLAAVAITAPALGARKPETTRYVVVLKSGATPDPSALRSGCADKLAAYKVPAHWEIRDEPLPRNASGKVLKNVLVGEAENRFIEE